MSNDETGSGAASAPLQFDRAEIATSAPSTCGACSRAIRVRYWTLNGKPFCGDCKAAIEQHMSGPVPWKTWLRVLVLGGGAALLGTIIYFAVLKLTGYEIGLIAIVVGVLVGRAVLKASGGRRGWKFQLAAMALTYVSIVASYMPAVYAALRDNFDKKHAASASASAPPPSAAPSTTAPPSAAPPTAAPPAPAAAPTAATAPAATESAATAPAAAPPSGKAKFYASHPILAVLLFVVILFAVAAIAPWVAGVHNIIGLVIIGIALYEAWKINRRVPLVFAGPFEVSAAA